MRVAIQSTHPEELFQKLKSVLDKNEVEWFNEEYMFEGIWGDIKLEIEVCKLPRMDSFGIRLNRILGDI